MSAHSLSFRNCERYLERENIYGKSVSHTLYCIVLVDSYSLERRQEREREKGEGDGRNQHNHHDTKISIGPIDPIAGCFRYL